MLYRVDMSNLVVSQDQDGAYQEFGGKLLCFQIIKREAAHAHPSSADNKLVLAAGLLSGTGAPNTGRLFIGAVSPLAHEFTASSAGGGMDNKLARLGIQGIIIEGMPCKQIGYVLYVSRTGAFLKAAPELAGLNIYAAVAKLQERYGVETAIACIGQAGENKLLTACIGLTDWQGKPTHQAGRGGLGAVMHSKGLKAIVIDDKAADKVVIADKVSFTKGASKLLKSLTLQFSDRKNEDPCLPGCIIPCPNRKNSIERPIVKGRRIGEWLGISDFKELSHIFKLCDDYGIDIVEFSKAVNMANKAGIVRSHGIKEIIAIIQELGQNTLLGRVIGSGSDIAAKVFGVFDLAKAPKKNQELELIKCLLDGMGLCKFITMAIVVEPTGLDGVVEMCNARYGWHKNLAEYLKVCQEVIDVD
jgi:aldehyde:ferredoxin oxidoreductase